MRSSNPALSRAFTAAPRAHSGEQMTITGTTNKCLILLAIVIAAAGWTWSQLWGSISDPMAEGMPPALVGYIAAGAILGLILALVTAFKPTWSPVTAPLYALCEGVLLGGISSMFELKFPGIAMQAVVLTFGTLFGLLFAYRAGIIRATEKFKKVVSTATLGIFFVYLASWILGFFGAGIPYIHESGMIGIGFSLFVVVIAALNLVLDFDFIEQGANNGAPRYMEWYGAFGLIVTLVWLYVEFLILLAKLRSND